MSLHLRPAGGAPHLRAGRRRRQDEPVALQREQRALAQHRLVPAPQLLQGRLVLRAAACRGSANAPWQSHACSGNRHEPGVQGLLCAKACSGLRHRRHA